MSIFLKFNSFKEENKIIKNNKNTSSLPQIEINGVNQEKEINEEKQVKKIIFCKI